jgi:glucosamine--fructose-6-phosphate aminotransferase (isomerizing)
MEPIRPEVMISQVEDLPGDLRDQAGPLSERVADLLTPQEWASTGTVYLTGDGDSYHAACAAEMAFESIAGVTCEPLSALRLLEYGTPWLHPAGSRRPLVIAVSASGSTPRAAQAIESSRQHGALTIAITGAADGAVTRAADRAAVIRLPHLGRSPGIRTYQASLLGLLLTAIRLGEARGQYPELQARGLRDELAGLADAVDATASAIKDRCRDVASMAAGSPVLVMTGSGPSFGTALFSAAKMTEAAGIFAAGQDLEEWCHVECHAYPGDMPVFVIAPPGRSHWRAAGLAATARRLGRQVIAVTHEDDTDVTGHASIALPVHGHTREEFSPLLYHVFAGYVASYLAQQLGRLPFQADRSPQPPASHP